MKTRALIAIINFLLIIVTSSAVHADCFTTAATNHGVDEDILRAIAKVESNYNPEAVNPSSHALGEMQIHPVNFAALQKYGITETDLHHACTNINVGAWILAGFIKQYGRVWRAVGAYGVGNDKSPKAEADRAIYAAKVQEALANIQRKKNKLVVVEKYIRKPVMVVLE
jgi:soluble lytic murein transglycosylase-like protein